MRNNIDIYADNMMLSEQDLKAKKLQQSVIDRILRLRDIHAYMLRNPLKKDREYVDYIVYNAASLGNGGEITRRTAYADLEILHSIVGSLEKCSKEWHRWRLNNMIMEGYRMAVNKQDPEAIAKLANVYGKYNQLDKNDEKDARYEEIPQIKFTFDATVLGLKSIPNVANVINQLIKKYSGSNYEDIDADVDVIDATVVEEPKKLEAKNEQ